MCLPSVIFLNFHTTAPTSSTFIIPLTWWPCPLFQVLQSLRISPLPSGSCCSERLAFEQTSKFLYSCTCYVSSLYFSAYQCMSVLLCLPVAMINIDQSPTRGSESLFGLKVTVHPSSGQAEQEVIARSWRHTLKEKWGMLPLGLLPLICTDSFLIYPVTICPGGLGENNPQ